MNGISVLLSSMFPLSFELNFFFCKIDFSTFYVVISKHNNTPWGFRFLDVFKVFNSKSTHSPHSSGIWQLFLPQGSAFSGHFGWSKAICLSVFEIRTPFAVCWDFLLVFNRKRRKLTEFINFLGVLHCSSEPGTIFEPLRIGKSFQCCLVGELIIKKEALTSLQGRTNP